MVPVRRVAQRLFARVYEFLAKQHHFHKYKEALESGRLMVGKYTYGIAAVHNYKGSERNVVIGRYCSIAPGVKIITGAFIPLIRCQHSCFGFSGTCLAHTRTARRRPTATS